MVRLLVSSLLICAATAVPAVAMDRYGNIANSGSRATVSDPDERLERLAAAGATDTSSRAKPKKSARAVLRDDPYLKDAFGWLDNK